MNSNNPYLLRDNWFGSLPPSWSINRIGFLFKDRNEKVNDTDYPPLSVTKKGILPQLATVAKSDSHDNRKKVLQNDFVINSRSDRKGSSGLSSLDGSVSLINTVLEPSNNIFPQFSEYLFKSYEFIEEFYRHGKGIVADLWSTRFSEMRNIPIPVPPFEVQTQIANFLDTKTQQIDQLIQNKQQKIKLLQEKRTAVINQAVTKGLNPEVEMKDSGVEWIGEIPKGWNLVQMNHYATKLTNGFVGVTRDIMKDRGIPYIQGIHIKDRQIKFTPDGFYYVTAEWSNSHSKSILKNGDILVVQTGSIGQVALVTEEYEGANCHALIIVRLSDEHCVGTFLSYFFLSNYMQSFLQQIKTGEILHHLNTTKIKYAKILLPPLSEQQQIVSYLDTKTQQIDNLISKEQRKIELLQEYRQSLISDAVTGKIDVREAG